MRIQKEVRQRVDVPEVTFGDLMTMTEAAHYLGLTVGNIRNYLDRGALTPYYTGEIHSLRGTEIRYVLRAEVETLRERREVEADDSDGGEE